MLSWEQIDRYWERLRECMKIESSGDKNKALIDLRNEVGASYCGRDVGSASEQAAINIAAIQQALQTASMVATCRTTAENVELTRNALSETRRAQKWTIVAVLATVAMAAATIATAIATWITPYG